MGKNDEDMNNNKNVSDVEIVFNQIRNLSKEYRYVIRRKGIKITFILCTSNPRTGWSLHFSTVRLK